MQTIDIAQAIKENSTSVSQNLDSSVLEELLPEATSEKKGLMSIDSFKDVEISVDIRGYSMIRVIKTNMIWNPIRPFFVFLHYKGLIHIGGILRGSSEDSDVIVSKISGSVGNFKFYKKIEDGYLNVYIYSSDNEKSPSMVYLKRRYLIGSIIKNVTDLSGYEEIIPK